jgi:DNA-binding response OmpR family regulator
MHPAGESKPGQDGKTVLFVDDHEELVRTVCQHLIDNGFHVLTAPNGEEALRVLTIHPGVVDLLITDVVMPNLSGWELARKAKEVRPNLKVLFITGSFARDVSELPEPTVQKPFRMQVLLAKVQELLAAD